ncbi:MAG: hypothetical protein Q9162_003573 [Coniocarpon cinnabarinum]
MADGGRTVFAMPSSELTLSIQGNDVRANDVDRPFQDSASVTSHASELDHGGRYAESHRSTSVLLRDDDEDADATPRGSHSDDQYRAPAQGSGQGNDGFQARPRFGSTGQFLSEEAYLDALRAFVSEKQYFRPGELSGDTDAGLVGFYGKTTMEDYTNRPGLNVHFGKRRGKQNSGPGRRAPVDATGSRNSDNTTHPPDPASKRRKSSIGDLLRRQRTR